MNIPPAVLLGLVVTIAVTTLADRFLSAPSSDIEWAIHLVYRLLFVLGGCALTARLAARRPARAALILGALLTGFAAMWLMQSWRDASVPRWHPALLVLLAMPAAWLGGRLGGRTGSIA